MYPENAKVGGVLAQPMTQTERVAREKAAIESALDQQEISLNVLADLAESLFTKFAPVLNELQLKDEANGPVMPFEGSSRVYIRLMDDNSRINYVADRLRYLRDIAEV